METTSSVSGASLGSLKRSNDMGDETEPKRLKIETTPRPYLPSELWGLILDYLEYSDVMQCAAVSRFFLNDVLSKISVLFMNNKNQLKPEQARRFKEGSVKSVIFVCFLKRVVVTDAAGSFTDRDAACEITATKSVPFLQLFSGLKCVKFCGYLPQEQEDELGWAGIDSHTTTKSGVCCRPFVRLLDARSIVPSEQAQFNEIARGLLKALSSAMYFRLLPPDLWIEDCSKFVRCCDRRSEMCEFCNHVCKSISFEQAFSLVSDLGIPCFPKSRLISIIAHREGGRLFLRDPKRLLPLVYGYFSHTAVYFRFGVVLAVRGRVDFLSCIRLLVDLGCDPRGLHRDELLCHLKKTGWNLPLRRAPESEEFVRELIALGFNITEADLLKSREELDAEGSDAIASSEERDNLDGGGSEAASADTS